MRFMLLLTPDGPGERAAPVDTARWTEYNEELLRAGVLLAFDRLQPVSREARVVLPHGRPGSNRDSMPATSSAIGGYWMIQVRSAEEAIEWATRCPILPEESIEIRRVQEGVSRSGAGQWEGRESRGAGGPMGPMGPSGSPTV